MTLWVGQDGTLDDDEGDGAAAPGSTGGYTDDAGDADAGGDVGGDETQAEGGDEGGTDEAAPEVVEEDVDVDYDQPIESVYNSVEVFEPSMYLPGEVVYYGGVPHFTRRYLERVGRWPRRRGRIEIERARPSFFERLVGRRPRVEEMRVQPRRMITRWERELIELRRLYPGREREILEMHRLYPGRERAMFEARVHHERERAHRAHPEHPAHPAHAHAPPAHGAPPGHVAPPTHGAPPTTTTPKASAYSPPTQPQQMTGPKAASAQKKYQPPPAQELTPQQIAAHAASGEFTGYYPLTDYDGYLFIDGPGAYWVWTITEPWLPPVYPPNYVPPMFPPAWTPEMIAAAEMPPWDVARSELVYPEEEAEPEQQTVTSGDPGCPPGWHWEPRGGVNICAPDAPDWLMQYMQKQPPQPTPAPPHAAGFDMPLTDYFGNLLVAEHPFHHDYPWPPTFGPPVLTGFSGDEVLGEVQMMLKQIGYGVEVDGILGPKTVAAIRSIQSRCGLQPDGKLTGETIDCITRLANLPYGHVLTGFDMPLTDYEGNLIVASQPIPWGGPVLTGSDVPFTDQYGRLLIGPGQYGTFTVPNPWDWSTWDDINLDIIDTEGDPQWFVVGQDDLGSTLGSALGSLGSGSGGGGGGGASDFGSALGSIFGGDKGGGGGGLLGGDGAGGTDIGSVLGSIATTAAKQALPVLAKAGTQALVKAAQQQGGGAQPPPPTTTHPAQPPPTTTHPAQPPAGHPGAPARGGKKPQLTPEQQAAHKAMNALMAQARQLGQKYGLTRPGPGRAAPTQQQPSGGTP